MERVNIRIEAQDVDESYIEVFTAAVMNINPKIHKLLLEKDLNIILTNCVYDIKSKSEISKNHEKFYEQKYANELVESFPTRGIMSDEKKCIALFLKNINYNDLEAILYHELGHFLDAYDNFGHIESLNDLAFSSSDAFKDAYKKDFIQNWELIKKDDNFRLRHFVQNSTPESFQQSALSESFAEIFRYLNNLHNDTKTVELYFPTAIDVAYNLIFNKFGNIFNQQKGGYA